ncbi:MAG: hypothetical protein CVV02_05440 [Firmicutes bacterium HGW-Firmicutes-7]|nr:MAG: hypothetical protein CVV02_05440 [Firmicutes bacterium HGW-Firmicutes-7]
MEAFCLIHLSDLHIDVDEDSNEKMIRENIKEDIKKLMNKHDLKINALVITGDIINKAKYKSYGLAESTIREILQTANLTDDNLIIVPGNHDIHRDKTIGSILDSFSQQILDKDDFISNEWNYVEPRFIYYRKYIEKVMPWSKDKIPVGYGIKELIFNNKKVRFNLLNTTWSSKGNGDYQNLYIGRWQLEYIRKQIESLPDCDLSITLSHHPFRWLKNEEEEMVKDYLQNNKKIGTDIILHGHVHNAKLEVTGTPNKLMLELTSGVGYPEKDTIVAGQPKIEKCRYSVYRFDIDNKNVECICRISTDNGSFVPDNSLYSSDKQDGCFQLSWDKKEKAIDEIACLYLSDIEFDPVPVAAGWCGRKVELELLSKHNLSAALISGVGGQGKTALASELLRRNKSNEKIFYDACIWVDCRELPDTMHLKILQLLEVVSSGVESVILYKDEKIENTISRFYNQIKYKKLLIVFDNIDAYVNLEREELVGELKDLLDIVLDREHSSKIIMTSRIPVYDHRANFKTIKLEGLNELEGIEYFIKRDIKLDDNVELLYCKKIINLTKGHPWWIGLIIGQISTNGYGLKHYMETNGTNILSGTTQLKQYFDEIWETLGINNFGKIGQRLVRYLVETSKPLTANEICSLDKATTFQKANKVLELLKKLNLLEAHEDSLTREVYFQVHPLVREFIHNNYSVEKQKPYVCTILKLFVDSRIVNAIFYGREQLSDNFSGYKNVKDLIYSIDTCINSRNSSQALALIVQYYKDIRDEGFHQDFVSLSYRILNVIEWDKEQIVKVKRKAEFLSDLIDTSDKIDNGEKSNAYIMKYDSLIEKNTIPYSGLLGALANREWRHCRFDKALKHISEYEEMKKKHSDLWDFMYIDNVKGLVLRDKGLIEEALEIFNKQSESSSTLGNIARCLQKKGDVIGALKKLKLSLLLLLKEDDLNAYSNQGYAYLWIADGMYNLNKYRFAKCFLYLCDKMWKEYSPGLLLDTKELNEKLSNIVVDDIEIESKRLLDEYLDSDLFFDLLIN